MHPQIECDWGLVLLFLDEWTFIQPKEKSMMLVQLTTTAAVAAI